LSKYSSAVRPERSVNRPRNVAAAAMAAASSSVFIVENCLPAPRASSVSPTKAEEPASQNPNDPHCNDCRASEPRATPKWKQTGKSRRLHLSRHEPTHIATERRRPIALQIGEPNECGAHRDRRHEADRQRDDRTVLPEEAGGHRGCAYVGD